METVLSPYVSQFEEFFDSNYRRDLEKLAEAYPRLRSLDVNFKKLDAFDVDLADDLVQKPTVIIPAARDAVSQMSLVTSDGTTIIPNVRFFDLPKEHRLQIRDLNAEHINRFFTAPCIVTKITDVKPKITVASFECRHCSRVYTIPQTDLTGKLFEPAICSCERRNFQLLLDQSKFIDTQRAEIQEPLEMLRGGEQAKTIAIWLQDDLTNEILPGDKLEVTGTFLLKTPKSRGSIYDKFIDANHIFKLEREFEEIPITKEEAEKIKELGADPKIYDKITASIAPSIYGHREIKEAIALQLFGGTPGKVAPDGMKIRPDMHVLLIGDPGCLVADERVVLGNGSFVKIGEIGKRHLEPIDLQVLTGQGYRRDTATVFHIYKDQPILEILTESGKSIRGTYNHPLLTVKNRERKWKRLDEIKLGDRVATVFWVPCTITAPIKMPRKYGPRSRSKLPTHVTPNLAGLIGYILGDGWVKEKSVSFLVASKENDILPVLISFSEELFGFKPNVRARKPSPGRTVVLTEVEICDVDIARCLAFLKEKRVPDLIMQSGNAAVAEFLAWLFEADGCVFCKGRGSRAIQLKSASIELLRDVQMLLLRFGVHSRIAERNLAIRRSESILLFSKSIGFRSKKKKEKLKQLVDECKNLLKTKQSCRHRKISERVVAVQPAGFADVFDIEVPKGHRFIANGIVSHNTGKSQILRYVKGLAPKGVYVSGKATTGAGLTATAEKDDFAEGGWTLKAGALVLAAGGMAMIDEFDLMDEEDRSSMHEAMESQEIHIAKAGIVTNFKANTTILAAANPKYGRFDPFSLPAEQFDILPTILSRFDLIFPMRDTIDEIRDREMADQILLTHQTASARAAGRGSAEMEEKEKKIMPVIEPSLLRRYVAYARKNIRPVLTEEAMRKIQSFYLDLRKIGETQTSIPITARQLEAIVRLAEASAKGRLSQKVELEDAIRAITLIKFYLKEVGIDPETGKFDIDIIATGTSKSKMDRVKIVFRIIKRLAEEHDEVQHEMILEEAKAQGVKPEDLEDALSILRRNGDVYSPRYGVYRPAEER